MRKIVVCLLAAATLQVPAAVQAADFCTAVKDLIGEAPENFSGRTAEPVPAFADAERCSTARAQSGAVSYHCAWRFPYRADAADAAFQERNTSLRNCLGEGTDMTKDQGVNHPDSYNLHLYRVDDVLVALSLKDKAALGHSFLVIRVEAAGKR